MPALLPHPLPALGRHKCAQYQASGCPKAGARGDGLAATGYTKVTIRRLVKEAEIQCADNGVCESAANGARRPRTPSKAAVQADRERGRDADLTDDTWRSEKDGIGADSGDVTAKDQLAFPRYFILRVGLSKDNARAITFVQCLRRRLGRQREHAAAERRESQRSALDHDGRSESAPIAHCNPGPKGASIKIPRARATWRQGRATAAMPGFLLLPDQIEFVVTDTAGAVHHADDCRVVVGR